MKNKTLTVSIAILTYKRKEIALSLLQSLQPLLHLLEDVVIVDNCSGEGLEEAVAAKFVSEDKIKVLTLPENVGTEGRNLGIQHAKGNVVILLDDDIFGITPMAIEHIRERFSRQPELAVLCFQVRHAGNGKVINWCHHKPKDRYQSHNFETFEITEGACAIDRDKFMACGGFPGHFFISHEGPDLALRLMDRGYEVHYTPEVTVKHHQSTLGRPSWRRYYYDTRNTVWLAKRQLPTFYAAKFLTIQLGAMLIYAARDHYTKYWFIAVRDALKGLNDENNHRRPIRHDTLKKIKTLLKDETPFLRKAYERLSAKSVEI